MEHKTIDRFRGCIYGQTIGDALGLGTEFMTDEDIAWKYPHGLQHYKQIYQDRHRKRWEIGDWTDDTDMMLAIKEGLGRGETEFHLYGGMGGRTDHTIANLQGLLYLADHGAQGWLYGDRERFTAIRDGSITLPAREKGIVSVFCMGADAQGVTIEGGQYTVHDAVLTSSFPLGVSNHYVGNPVRVTVTRGSLLIALIEKE